MPFRFTALNRRAAIRIFCAQEPTRNENSIAGALEFSQPSIGPLEPPLRTRLPPMLLDDPAILNALRAMEGYRASALPIVPLEAVAAQAGLSLHHFQRRFSAVMGETVGAFARRQRLETAAMLLKMTETSVLQIAVAVGYNSTEAFSRAFLRQFGHGPSQYRVWSRAAATPSEPHEYELARHVSADSRNTLNLLAVRFFGSHARVGEYWQAFARLLEEAEIDTRGKRFFGISLDDPQITPRGLMRYDCAIEAPQPMPASLHGTPFSAMSLPRSRVARARHRGPYHTVFSSYRAIIIWVSEKLQQFGDAPGLEIYDELPWRAGLDQPDNFAVELAIL